MKDDWKPYLRVRVDLTKTLLCGPAVTSTIAIYDVRFMGSSRLLCANSVVSIRRAETAKTTPGAPSRSPLRMGGKREKAVFGWERGRARNGHSLKAL